MFNKLHVIWLRNLLRPTNSPLKWEEIKQLGSLGDKAWVWMILKRTLRHVFQFFLGEVRFSKENALQISPKFLLHR